jgi:hypothetical protein
MNEAAANLDDTTHGERKHARRFVACHALLSRSRRISMVLLLTALMANTAWAAPTPEEPVVAATPSEHHGSVFVDPLGFLLFGPRLGVEVGAEHVAGAVYGRWFNAGYLAHGMFLNDDESFQFSFGAGLRGRYYARQGLAGFHLGLALEYLAVRTESPSKLLLTKSAYLVPQFETGYRFSRSGLYAGASGSVGYAFRTSGTVEDLPGGRNAGLYQAQDNSSIYGSANLELGVYF